MEGCKKVVILNQFHGFFLVLFLVIRKLIFYNLRKMQDLEGKVSFMTSQSSNFNVKKILSSIPFLLSTYFQYIESFIQSKVGRYVIMSRDGQWVPMDTPCVTC